MNMKDILHLLDANVLIDANRDYYPIDRVPEFWTWLAAKGEQGSVKVPQDVYEKLTPADDELSKWLKTNRDPLLWREVVDPKLIERVINEGYGIQVDEQIDEVDLEN